MIFVNLGPCEVSLIEHFRGVLYEGFHSIQVNIDYSA